MIKKIGFLMLHLFVSSSFALTSCPNALPTNDSQFCNSFKTAARCYCTASGLPAGLCGDVHQLYSRMIALFRTVEKACKSQKYTTTEDCMDNWHCFLQGGVDSHQRICSSNYNRCS